MATATAMYHSGKNPLRRVTRNSEKVRVPKGIRVRRLHKAFLRYHDANNWPVLREALRRMGRADLIGNGKQLWGGFYRPSLPRPPRPTASALWAGNIRLSPVFALRELCHARVDQLRVQPLQPEWHTGPPVGHAQHFGFATSEPFAHQASCFNRIHPGCCPHLLFLP